MKNNIKFVIVLFINSILTQFVNASQDDFIDNLLGNWIGGSVSTELYNPPIPPRYSDKCPYVSFNAKYFSFKKIPFNEFSNLMYSFRDYSGVGVTGYFENSKKSTLELVTSEICFYDENIECLISLRPYTNLYIWLLKQNEIFKISLKDENNSVDLSKLECGLNSFCTFKIEKKQEKLVYERYSSGKNISTSILSYDSRGVFNPVSENYALMWQMHRFGWNNVNKEEFYAQFKIFEKIINGEKEDINGMYNLSVKALNYMKRFEGKWAYEVYDEKGVKIVDRGYAYGWSDNFNTILLFKPENLKNNSGSKKSIYGVKNFFIVENKTKYNFKNPVRLIIYDSNINIVRESEIVRYEAIENSKLGGGGTPLDENIFKNPNVIVIYNKGYKLEFSKDAQELVEYVKYNNEWVLYRKLKKLSI